MIATGGFASPPTAALEFVDERPTQVSTQKPADKVAPLKTAFEVRVCGGDSEKVDAHKLALEVVVGGGDVTKKRRPPLRSGEAAGRSTRTPEDAPVGDELWVGRLPRTAGQVWRRVQLIEADLKSAKELSTSVVDTECGVLGVGSNNNVGFVDIDGVGPVLRRVQLIEAVVSNKELSTGVVDTECGVLGAGLGDINDDFAGSELTSDGGREEGCLPGVVVSGADDGDGSCGIVLEGPGGPSEGGGAIDDDARSGGDVIGDDIYAVDGGATEKRRRRLLVKWRKRWRPWRPVAGRSERRNRRTPRTADTGDSDVLGSNWADEEGDDEQDLQEGDDDLVGTEDEGLLSWGLLHPCPNYAPPSPVEGAVVEQHCDSLSVATDCQATIRVPGAGPRWADDSDDLLLAVPERGAPLAPGQFFEINEACDIQLARRVCACNCVDPALCSLCMAFAKTQRDSTAVLDKLRDIFGKL
jgi:hypothetical protein